MNAVKEHLIDDLKEFDQVDIITSKQFTMQEDQNRPHIVVVGLTEKENVNPGLKDYKFKLCIAVNCFIADDLQADIFDDVVSIIERQMMKYVTKQVDLEGLFGTLPVVGLLHSNTQYSEDGKSHIANLVFDLWTSE